MNTLIDWIGKTEDITITYDAGVRSSDLLLAGGSVDFGKNLPAIIYPTYDNICEVEEVEWNESVKKADRVDYLTAIACGSIAGLIDIFYVGEFSIENANKWGDEQIGKFVKKVAELNGYKGDDLSGAIQHLEQRFKIAADGNTPEFGGGRQHHLRDFSHHFSLGGLLCSLFTQFTGKVIGTDTAGRLLIVKAKDTTLIGKNFEEKILFGTVNWFFHMVSDMAGSNATAGKGTGIPGVVVSMIKELSVLPCFRDKKLGEVEFHTWVSKLFNGTLLAKRDENGKIIEAVKFDLRTEIGILHEVGRQFVPVLINECLVRGLYFVRRLYNAIRDTEIHSIKDLKNIDTSELLPVNNRVIRRMITVASGTFTAIDTVDAAVRAAIKNKSLKNPKFYVDFAVRINFVGIGRFIIACKADATFITEDIREAKEKRDKTEKDYEKMISDLKCLSLDYEQMQVMYSIENLIIEDDLAKTEKDIERAEKRKWRREWQKQLLDELPITEEASRSFFLDEQQIGTFINSQGDESWQQLIAMESVLFSPYYPIYGDDEKNKPLKKLKCKSDYLTKSFPGTQEHITEEDIKALQKAYKHATGTITGSRKNLIIGAVGTTAVVVASGGLAFTFAPAIATAIVGESAAGLSGAALVSYSLAAIGGGSLAAGGLGMAGGTAIITGGGALLGVIGGTSVSAATTLNLLAQDGYVLSECCKLITFSKVVLIDKYKDWKSVTDIQAKVGGRIDALQSQIDKMSDVDADDLDDEEKKERKQKLKVAAKSMKYLRRCDSALQKLLKDKPMDDGMKKLPEPIV